MQIQKLTISNFKGFSGSWDLAPVTLITGANFSHKTTIPLALRLGLAGYLPPPIGQKKVYSLAGNPEGQGQMEIGLMLSAGRKVSWKWKKDAEGKVSTEGGIGADIAMPELMLDPRLFFAKTATEQVQTIFSVCEIGPEDFSADTMKMVMNNEIRSQKILDEIFAWIESKPVKRIPVWMAEHVDWLKLQAKTAAEDQKKLSGAFQAFPKGGPAVKDVSKQLSDARAQLFDLQKGVSHSGLREKHDLLAEQLKPYGSPEWYTAEIAKLETEISKAAYEPDEIEEAQESLVELTTAASAYRMKAQQAAATVELLKKQYGELEAAEECPTCHSSKRGWKTGAMKTLMDQITDAIGTRDLAQKQADSARQKMEGLQNWLANVSKLEAMQKDRDKVSELIGRIVEIDSKLNEQQETDKDLPAKIADAQQRVIAIEEQQRAWDQWAADRKRKEDLEGRLLEAEQRAELFKHAVKLAVQEQSRLVGRAFTKVLNVARHFTDGLLNSPLEFRDGALGRKVSKADTAAGCEAPEGAWIPFDAFSGTEELLALAGFSVALTGDAPVKLVILDELGRLDGKRKLDVTLRMLSLTEKGIIDQAVLIDVDPKPYAGLTARAGFKSITL